MGIVHHANFGNAHIKFGGCNWSNINGWFTEEWPFINHIDIAFSDAGGDSGRQWGCYGWSRSILLSTSTFIECIVNSGDIIGALNSIHSPQNQFAVSL